jgi:hypothetical protein
MIYDILPIIELNEKNISWFLTNGLLPPENNTWLSFLGKMFYIVNSLKANLRYESQKIQKEN